MKRITMDDACKDESHIRLQTRDALAYLKAVKTTFENETGKYDMFAAILKDFKAQRIEVAEFLAKMREILKGHDFLMLGFNVFLPKGYEIPPSYDQNLNLHNNNVHKHNKIQLQKKQMNKKPLNNEKGKDKKPHKKETKDNAGAVQENGLNSKKGRDKKPDMNETKSVHQEIGLNKSKRRHNKKNKIKNRKANNNNNRSDDHLFLREVDLSKCERHDISYVCLPEDCQSPIASGRSELDTSVLNDRFVLNPQTDQHYSKSKKMLNKYQQLLFKVEDEQYEVDMSLECLRSARESFKEVYQNIVENKIKVKGPLHLEEHFRVSHLRLIETMYGKYGLEALEALRNEPTVALPTMLEHLEEKHEDWKDSHSYLETVWAKDYAHNHAKSLGFRS